MKIKTVYFFGLLTYITACTNSTNETGNIDNEPTDSINWANDLSCEEGWSKFNNTYFALCFPDDWSVNDSGTFGSDLVLTSPQIDNITDSRPFAQNINVMKQETASLLAYDIHDLDEYASFNKKQVETAMNQAEILSFTKTTLAGIPAYKNTMTANQNGADLYFEQFIFKDKKHYFVMTFTASIEITEEAKALANEIMNSLRIR